jgi:hypothetical protein
MKKIIVTLAAFLTMGTLVASEAEARPGRGYHRGYAPYAYRAPRAYGRVYAARPYGYGYGYRYRRPNYGAAAAVGVGAALLGGLAAQQYYATQPYYACDPYYGC